MTYTVPMESDLLSGRAAEAGERGKGPGAPGPRAWRIARLAFIAACCLLALHYSISQLSKYPRWLVDDAYINFRYAENLVRSGELTWNPGEDPVEGYTGVAMVWLLSVAMKMGIAPEAAAHGIGIFFYLFGAGVLLTALGGLTLASAAVLSLYLTAPFLYSHAWSGLETTMFMALVIFAVYNFTARNRRLFVASILMLSLARPEGILLSVILLVLFRPLSRTLALLYLVPFGVYFAWRWGYYGRLFPNTFYAKVYMESDENMLGALRRFFALYLQIPLLLAFVLATRGTVRAHLRLIAGVAVFAAACLGVYVSSKLTMTYAYRFFVPCYALVLLALGGAVRSARLDAKAVVLVALLAAAQIHKNVDTYLLKDAAEYSRTHYGMLEDEHIQAGRLLGEILSPDHWLVVHTDAGAIPYYSRMKTIDCGRLNDEYLTDTGRTREEVCDYLFSRDPAAMVFTSTNRNVVKHGPEADAITRDGRFQSYRLVRRYGSAHRPRYYQFVYLRNDLADTLGYGTLDAAGSGYSAPRPDPAGDGRAVAIGIPEDQGPAGGERPIAQERGENLGNADGLWEYAQHADDPQSRRSALEKLVRQYGDDPRAPEALWELAVMGEVPMQKIEKYQMLYDRYPAHPAAPKALLMIGFIYSEEIGAADRARTYFTKCIAEFPGTESAETAKTMLELAGTDTPWRVPN